MLLQYNKPYNNHGVILSNFIIAVYNLHDLRKRKTLIDEFTIEAETKEYAADYAHKTVENNILNNVPSYSNATLGRLMVETRRA